MYSMTTFYYNRKKRKYERLFYPFTYPDYARKRKGSFRGDARKAPRRGDYGFAESKPPVPPKSLSVKRPPSLRQPDAPPRKYLRGFRDAPSATPAQKRLSSALYDTAYYGPAAYGVYNALKWFKTGHDYYKVATGRKRPYDTGFAFDPEYSRKYQKMYDEL